MIVAGHSDGSVRAQLKDIDGTWPGTWTTVGDASITPAGSPSAVFSPTTGRMYAFVRATDGSIYWSRQTEPGSATWTPWDVVSLGGTHATDPTAFTWQNAEGQQVGFVTRNANLSVQLFRVAESHSAARASRVAAGDPTFTRHDIPAPSQR